MEDIGLIEQPLASNKNGHYKVEIQAPPIIKGKNTKQVSSNESLKISVRCWRDSLAVKSTVHFSINYMVVHSRLIPSSDMELYMQIESTHA